MEGPCTCGSGRFGRECCFREIELPATWAELTAPSTEEASALYYQLEEMRRTLGALVGARNPTESALDPRIDGRLIRRADPLPEDARPTFLGWPLTRPDLKFQGKRWSDPAGAAAQDRLAAVVEAFGEHLIEEFEIDAGAASEFEGVCHAYCDFLLMYHLMSPVDVKPGHRAIRRFLGNYYPRTRLDANLDFVYRALSALPAFHVYLGRAGLAEGSLVDHVVRECRDWPWYRRRLLEHAELRGRARARWCAEYDYRALPVG
jgi:hypothetical protein